MNTDKHFKGFIWSPRNGERSCLAVGDSESAGLKLLEGDLTILGLDERA